MSQSGSASRIRCLLVASGATVAALTLARTLTPMVRESSDTVAGILVRGCAGVLLACVVWAWATTITVVVEAWIGTVGRRTPGVPSALRRLVAAACGLALAGTASGGAMAGQDPGDHPAASLAGLPLPERAAAPERAPTKVSARPPSDRWVLVSRGDTLWAIAAEELPGDASDAEITRHWRRIHRMNLAVIGRDPHLILPGQRLALPAVGAHANPSEEAP